MNKYIMLCAVGLLAACGHDYVPCAVHEQNAKQPILFKYNSAEITPESKAILDDGLIYMTGHRFKTIHLDAYADEQGGYSKYNWDLSEKRANAVRDYLISNGVAAKRITTDFHGIEQGNPFPKYRRVEITIK